MRTSYVACLIAVTAGVACHTLAPLTFDEVDRLQPSRVWVTHADQSVLEVNGPRVFNDTLVGYVNGGFTELPASDVHRVVIKRPARAKTIGLIAGSTAVAAAIAVWLSGVGDPDESDMVNCPDEPDHPLCQS